MVVALFAQYRSIRGEIAALHEQKDAYVRSQSTSRLIHALQKERGLSAGMLANPTAKRAAKLQKQYEETDSVLAQAQIPGLQAGLLAVRQQVSGGTISWADARELYTASIDEALNAIAVKVMTGKPSNTMMHMAIVELAFAREDLGLIRATINSIYARGTDELADVTYLAKEEGKFRDHLNAFQRDMASQEQSVAMGELLDEPYEKVIGQVDDFLRHGPRAATDKPQDAWWADATRVIDHFKAMEDTLYRNLLQSADMEIANKEQELERYVMVAVGFGLVIALLTAFTILRILRALGILITTLDDVIKSENYSIRIHGESHKDEFGRISLSLNNLLDFTDALIRDKEKLAATDVLTGVLNRRSFMEAATREIGRANRYQSHFALIFIDIDHFKGINDRHGHAAGDKVLAHFVHVLKKYLRKSDMLARWGGEEFVILAPEANVDEGYQLADKLCTEVFATTFAAAGKITCSMGVAQWRPGESFDELSQRADKALYEAKEAGRNRVCRAG